MLARPRREKLHFRGVTEGIYIKIARRRRRNFYVSKGMGNWNSSYRRTQSGENEIEKHCVLKNPGFKKIGPPQAEIFEDLGGCFMQKMPPDCTQDRVLWYKNASKMLKIAACGGHIIIEIRLVNAPKVYFFAPAAGISSLLFRLLSIGV